MVIPAYTDKRFLSCWTGPQVLWSPQCPISVRKKKGFIWPFSAMERQEVSVTWLRRSSAKNVQIQAHKGDASNLFLSFYLAGIHLHLEGFSHPDLNIGNSGLYLEKSKTFLPQEVLHRIIRSNHIFQLQVLPPWRSDLRQTQALLWKELWSTRRCASLPSLPAQSTFLMGLVSGWASPFQGISFAVRVRTTSLPQEHLESYLVVLFSNKRLFAKVILHLHSK